MHTGFIVSALEVAPVEISGDITFKLTSVLFAWNSVIATLIQSSKEIAVSRFGTCFSGECMTFALSREIEILDLLNFATKGHQVLNGQQLTCLSHMYTSQEKR